MGFLLWHPASVFGAGCTAAGAPAPSSTPSIPSVADTKRQVAEYVDFGRYAADIAETVTRARNYLTARLARRGKLAIVLDVDETRAHD
jgi:hypothetical protein